ncbi:hypothetical protein CDL15_Pgr001656 [Punica granatum]|uniref:Gnk2-homologous domain-containing protein n=1 Tax=Punica granatum TaxID=22663 RepID=A0A218XCJ2_PUNGR|nr:hypothetical protein CDL15_Pgr001656 [Punica granatum]
MNMVYQACSQDVYDPQDPFKKSMTYVLTNVASQTATHGYDYYSSSPWPDSHAYAHGACSGSISNSDCATCMGVAFSKVMDFCAYKRGGQIQFQDCRIRYESYPFVN